MNRNYIKLIILDRDGTINIDKNGYTYKVNDCKLFKDAITFFSSISINTKIVVVTNQSGIARNYYSLNEFQEFNNKINDIIRDKANHPGIDDFFYCPHLPNDKCKCRKPKSYLIKKAIKKYNSSTSSTILIGDKLTDVQAGQDAGIRSYLITRNITKKIFPKDYFQIKSLDEIFIKDELDIPLKFI